MKFLQSKLVEIFVRAKFSFSSEVWNSNHIIALKCFTCHCPGFNLAFYPRLLWYWIGYICFYFYMQEYSVQLFLSIPLILCFLVILYYHSLCILVMCTFSCELVLCINCLDPLLLTNSRFILSLWQSAKSGLWIQTMLIISSYFIPSGKKNVTKFSEIFGFWKNVWWSFKRMGSPCGGVAFA